MQAMTKRSRHRSVEQLISAAGGSEVIALALGKTRDAVKKWRQSGIPDPSWFLFIAWAGATPDELYRANTPLRYPERDLPEQSVLAQRIADAKKIGVKLGAAT